MRRNNQSSIIQFIKAAYLFNFKKTLVSFSSTTFNFLSKKSYKWEIKLSYKIQYKYQFFLNSDFCNKLQICWQLSEWNRWSFSESINLVSVFLAKPVTFLFSYVQTFFDFNKSIKIPLLNSTKKMKNIEFNMKLIFFKNLRNMNNNTLLKELRM